MKTCIVTFQNHFDLLWRRCWEKDYDYQGKRYASYARVEEACILRWLELVEKGQGAFVIEQVLTLRMLLRKHPTLLRRLKTLYKKGLFDVQGAGEAIIDVNMCSPETMVRNLASGTHYCKTVLGISPLYAAHNDGFGSSAQFPQAIRACGYRGVTGLCYSYPDNDFWRGLDGSTVFCGIGLPGRSYFFDHCYHEPCRTCNGINYETCASCEGTGFDLPQNKYPPFEPVDPAVMKGDFGQYTIASEEMLPPEYFDATMRQWQKQNPDICYTWGTMRAYEHLWQSDLALVDLPPEDRISSKIENVPTMTGCYVSRLACKQLARRLESEYYGWEKALMNTCPAAVDRAWLEEMFLELALAFFHDSVTGSQQDIAHEELINRIQACRKKLRLVGEQTLKSALGPREHPVVQPNGSPRSMMIFNPNIGQSTAGRYPLPQYETGVFQSLVAVDGASVRHPIVFPWHTACSVLPPAPFRPINSVGPDARTRPERVTPRIEARGLSGLSWSALTIEAGAPPQEILENTLRNEHITVSLGEHGVSKISCSTTGRAITADQYAIGELCLEEDEGDPWSVRKKSSFRIGLQEFTKFMGAKRFDGYQEAWYAGRYEPNLTFALEKDGRMFSLEWYLTVRLMDGAERVDFGYEIFWKAIDRRLRAVFPVQAPVDTGFYSIPGGWLKRDRYNQTQTTLKTPDGDWPAVYFHASTTDSDGPGWALVNYGTPSARIEDGRLMTSVLRAVGFGHALERYAQTYPMPTSGMKDAGWHHIELSIMPHVGISDMPRVAVEASSLNQVGVAVDANACAPQSLYSVTGTDVEVLSIKAPFNASTNEDIVIRVLNNSTEPRVARVHRNDGNHLEVHNCNALEEYSTICEANVECTEHTIQLKPFEMQTLCAKLHGNVARIIYKFDGK